MYVLIEHGTNAYLMLSGGRVSADVAAVKPV